MTELNKWCKDVEHYFSLGFADARHIPIYPGCEIIITDGEYREMRGELLGLDDPGEDDCTAKIKLTLMKKEIYVPFGHITIAVVPNATTYAISKR